jgi:hypothetical protein
MPHPRLGAVLHTMQTNGSKRTFIVSLYVWFLRTMAVLCLIAALMNWAQLTGITQNGNLRFDMLDTHWRMLKTVLAVILPAAGLGLWMTQSWGVVLWLFAMCLELLAFGVWTELFEPRSMTVLTHSVAILFWALLSAGIFIEKRRQQRAGFEHL